MLKCVRTGICRQGSRVNCRTCSIAAHAKCAELWAKLMPHSITHGDACFAYFNKIWGIPNCRVVTEYSTRLTHGKCKPEFSDCVHQSNVRFRVRVQLVTATLLVVYRQGFRSPRSSAGVD